MKKFVLALAVLSIVAITVSAQSGGALVESEDGHSPCGALRGAICSEVVQRECIRWTVVQLLISSISPLPVPVTVCAEMRTTRSYEYYE